MRRASGIVRHPCFWMVIVALVIRLTALPFFLPEHINPARGHLTFGFEEGRVAQSIAEGKGFSSPLFADTGPTALLTPVFPYLLAGVFKIFGIYSNASALVILVLDDLFSSLTCILVFLIARESFGNQAALCSGWIWAFFPYSIYFTNDRIWDTWLATLLLSIIILIVLRLARSASTSLWVWYGLLWGVVGLTDANVLSLILPLGIWVCYRRHKLGQRWFVPNAVAALIFFAVVSPWFVRNYRVFHAFVPFRDGIGLELHVGNNGDTSHWFPRMAGPWKNEIEWKEYMQRGELGYMADKKRQALSYIRQHPVWFVWVSLRRAVYVWTGFWSFDKRYLAEEATDPYNIPFCTLLTTLAFVGLEHAFRERGADVAIPYLIVLFFFPLIYYVTHLDEWYRRPIDPFIVILAAYALASRPRLRRRSPA